MDGLSSILKEPEEWPVRTMLFVRRKEEVGVIKAWELTTIFDMDLKTPKYKYDTIEKIEEDGWTIDRG